MGTGPTQGPTGRRRIPSWVLLALLAAVLVGWFALNLVGGRVGA